MVRKRMRPRRIYTRESCARSVTGRQSARENSRAWLKRTCFWSLLNGEIDKIAKKWAWKHLITLLEEENHARILAKPLPIYCPKITLLNFAKIGKAKLRLKKHYSRYFDVKSAENGQFIGYVTYKGFWFSFWPKDERKWQRYNGKMKMPLLFLKII